MAGLWNRLFELSAGMAEAGLLMADSAMRTMQSAVSGMARSELRPLPASPPFNGPATLDDATSEFSNRLFRLWWAVRSSPQGMLTSWSDVLHAARHSFSGISFNDPRQWLTLPLELPLSMGTLLTQQSLRGIYAAHVVGPDRVMDFAGYMADSLIDVHVFVSLQYKDLLKRYDELIRKIRMTSTHG
jgi:hypothetical protein